MNNNDLQTLIDLPSGHPVDYYDREAMTHFEVGCTTDTLTSLALELKERREFDEWRIDSTQGSLVQESIDRSDGKIIWALYSGHTGESVSRGKTPFEAWQNAKEAGKL